MDNQGEIMQHLGKEKPTSSGKGLVVFFIIIGVLSTIGLTLALSAPDPYKKWGGFVAVASIASLMTLRASSEIFTRKISLAILPYNIATYVAIVAVIAFAPPPDAVIATGVLLWVVGIVAFYWFVSIVVYGIKTFPLPKKNN